MALKPKPKSFELDILSEAEVAQEKIAKSRPIEEVIQELFDDNHPDKPRVYVPSATVMSKKWHAGVDMETLPAMTDAEEELFNKLRQRGTYMVVIKQGRKYYLGGEQVGVDPSSEQLKTSLITAMIKKGWLAKSVRDDMEAYFVTSHMVFAWRKKMGI